MEKAIHVQHGFDDSAAMARRRKERPPTASEQLEALLGSPWPFTGRPPKYDLSSWTVRDDWLDPVPVTETEVEIFEHWFGDLFDTLFGSDCGSPSSQIEIALENDTKK